MKPIKRISVIGAGNVATSVSKAIVNKGFTLVQVIGRKMENVQALLAKLNSEQLIEAVTDFNRLNKEVDCFPTSLNACLLFFGRFFLPDLSELL